MGSVSAGGGCAVRGRERERRRSRDWASSLELGRSGGLGGSWGDSHGAAWYWGGAEIPRPPLTRQVGVRRRQGLVVRVE